MIWLKDILEWYSMAGLSAPMQATARILATSGLRYNPSTNKIYDDVSEIVPTLTVCPTDTSQTTIMEQVFMPCIRRAHKRRKTVQL